ncbi:MAG: hypothetical protein ACYSU0_13425, partial [Planctomycetota bacterium]
QEARGHLKSGEPEKAVSTWKKAARHFLMLAENVANVSESSYYLAGDTSYRAMVEVTKLAQEDPQRSTEARALARQALAAYEKFVEKASAAPEGSSAEAAKRKKHLEATARAKEYIEKAYGPAP